MKSVVQGKNHLAKKLSFKQIPVLPPGITELLKTLTDDSLDFVELARFLERYPSIAARLIAVANSAWSSPVTEVSSLEMACSRLGIDVIRSTSIAYAIAAPFNANRCIGFNAKYFWTTALLAADAVTWLRAESKALQLEPATVRTAGLLHNLGLLLLADQLPEEVHTAIRLAEDDKDENLPLSDALLYVLGFNHHDAGLLLAQAWNFPEPLVDAMAYTAVRDGGNESAGEDSNEMTSLICVALSMIHSLQYSHRPWSIPQAQLEKLQISLVQATEIFERLSEQLLNLQELANTLFNA